MPDRNSWLDRWLLHTLQRVCGGEEHLQLRLANPETPPVGSPAPRTSRAAPEDAATGTGKGHNGAPVIRIAGRRALLGLLLDPEVAFGDHYTAGRIQVEGDLVELLEAVYRAPAAEGTWLSHLVSKGLTAVQRNTRLGSRKHIHHHYDLPPEFYQKWLDERLVYTCAYFPEETVSLEEAQRAKLELVCRKLWLRPGETVVEAGCGWGALALYMARHLGVRVKAFNISHEQIAYAREQARRQGLDSRVEFIEDDYRNVTGRYDAFASVGMLEHVGREHYADLARVIQRTIGDSGRGLLHFIGRDRPSALSAWIRLRIFPGAYPPTLREALEVLEPGGYSVLDVENLRRHYAFTLEHWLHRFEDASAEIAARYGEAFVRKWRLYLAGSAAAFRVGTMQLFQVVFAGPRCRHAPFTRVGLYEGLGAAHPQEGSWQHLTY
jgi:cyclopropane-fatty-acyl-phospholipid synthase